MGIKAERLFGGKSLKGEYRQTRKGLRFFSNRELRRKGDLSYGFEIDPSPMLVARKIGNLPKRFGNLKELWPQILPVMRAMLKQTIASGSGPNGEAWAPPNASYTRRKGREGHGAAPLVRTGTLKTRLADVVTKTKSKLSVGIKNLPYSRAVNFGFRGPGTKKIGSRMFMGWSRAGVSRVRSILRRYHKQAIRDVVTEIRRAKRRLT